MFTEKPVAIMGAAGGPVGTARGQQDLKLILMSMLALVLPHPGVAVGVAQEKFDAAGALTPMGKVVDVAGPTFVGLARIP